MLIPIALLLIGIALGAGGVLLGIRVRSWLIEAGSGRRPWRTIAVPLVDRALPEAALSVAARLSAASSGHVVLLAVVQVPRTMAIDTETPPGLERALTHLENAERVVRGQGAQVHGEVVRVRQISDLVGRACVETGAEAVILEPDGTSPGATELLHALAEGKSSHSLDLVIARPHTNGVSTAV